MKSGLRQRAVRLSVLLLCLCAWRLAAPPAFALDTDVPTQHNDPARTGAQLHETLLQPSNVSPTTFGRLFQRQVDGQIIAQPLYISSLSIPNTGLRNVIYVATRANTVYAFDADDTDPDPTHGLIWSQPVTVEAAGPVPHMCSETVGPMGITSTPVIDRASGTLYLVARKLDGSIWLHALDIATGAPKSGTPGAVRITASYNGLNFDQSLELNRAGLLFVNGAIIVGFSALNCDNQGWHGWLLAYRATDLQQVGVFATTSASGWGGGVWASGKGIVGDSQDNIYFQTGNGSVQGNTDLGQSSVKLKLGPAPSYGFSLAGHYTVSNWAALNNGDTDLGSSGPVLLPGSRLVGGGKQGKLYVLDAQTMQPTQDGPGGGPVPPGGSDGVQAFINTWHDDAGQPVCMKPWTLLGTHCYMPHPRYEETETTGPNIHAGVVYWNGRLYGMPEKDYIRAYAYDAATGVLNTTPAAVSTVRAPDGMPGAALSLSANGNSNGIIWASIPKYDGQWQNVPGMLVAFDAMTLQELWRDDDDIGFAKFTPPTIGGGKVFRPTFANQLIVYGPKNAATPAGCYTVAQVYANFTGANGLLGAATGPETTAPDGIGRFQNFAGGAIYWTPSTCGHEVHGAIVGEWNASGLSQGFLGYPLTDETVTPDGIGRYNHLQNGSIYWTTTSGAHEVHGAIRSRWAALGWERSSLGYPVSDETDEIDGSGRVGLFEHGTIHWKRADGSITVQSDANMLLGPQQGNTDRPGADIANFVPPAANPTMCETACAGNVSCKAWTYVAPNTTQGPQPHCWIKSGIPLQQASSCCISGIKVAVQPRNISHMHGAVDRPGGDFAHFSLPVSDPRLCQGECAENGLCKAWAYVVPGGPPFQPQAQCWLKSSQPAEHPDECCSSGVTVAVTDVTIWRYTGTPCSGASCPGWQTLDDNTKTVKIAASTDLYQLHNDGRIWKSTGEPCATYSCPGWQMLDDNTKTVDIAVDGATLHQLHNDGMIWRYTGAPCSGESCPGWQMLDNNTKTVKIVASGGLYQLHNDGKIWKSTGTPCSGASCPGWQMLDDNTKAVDIAADGGGLYQLHNDGMIWRYTGTPCSGSSCPGWQMLDNNTKTVKIAASGGLFQLHNDGMIWKSTGSPCSGDSCPGWQMLDDNIKTVDIAADGGALYQLHNDGMIWRYTGTPCAGSACPGWQMLDDNPRTTEIAAGGGKLYQLHDDLLYQLHTDGTIWRYIGAPCSGNACPAWQMLDNNPATTAITAAGRQLFQLHTDGTIWRYTGTPCSGGGCPGWQMLDNNPQAAAVAAGDLLYQLHKDGTIWRYTGTPCNGSSCPGWQMLDNNPKTTAIAAARAQLFQLHNDGTIWRYFGTPCSGSACPGWQMLDDNPQAAAIAAADLLYQLHKDGTIWRYTGTPCSGNACPSWQLLDNNHAAMAIAAAGRQLFQLHNDGTIWRHTGTPCSGSACPGWQMLDNNPQAAAVAAGDPFYQLHHDGTIWRYTGTPCTGPSCPGWWQLDNNPATKAIAGSPMQ